VAGPWWFHRRCISPPCLPLCWQQCAGQAHACSERAELTSKSLQLSTPRSGGRRCPPAHPSLLFRPWQHPTAREPQPRRGASPRQSPQPWLPSTVKGWLTPLPGACSAPRRGPPGKWWAALATTMIQAAAAAGEVGTPPSLRSLTRNSRIEVATRASSTAYLSARLPNHGARGGLPCVPGCAETVPPPLAQAASYTTLTAIAHTLVVLAQERCTACIPDVPVDVMHPEGEIADVLPFAALSSCQHSLPVPVSGLSIFKSRFRTAGALRLLLPRWGVWTERNFDWMSARPVTNNLLPLTKLLTASAFKLQLQSCRRTQMSTLLRSPPVGRPWSDTPAAQQPAVTGLTPRGARQPASDRTCQAQAACERGTHGTAWTATLPGQWLLQGSLLHNSFCANRLPRAGKVIPKLVQNRTDVSPTNSCFSPTTKSIPKLVPGCVTQRHFGAFCPCATFASARRLAGVTRISRVVGRHSDRPRAAGCPPTGATSTFDRVVALV